MKNHTSTEQGMALLVALFFISISLILLSGISLRLVNQSHQVANYIQHKEAFTGLEAAYASSKVEIESGEDGMIGLGDWVMPSGGGIVLPDWEDDSLAPEDLNGLQDVQYLAYNQSWFNDGLDNNGDGTVDGTDERWMFTIHAMASKGNAHRQVEAIMRGRDVNVWRNAIFAGAGQAGGLINGNVSIHGSVHLLGSNILPGNTAITAIDLSGTSLVHNNYVGMPGDLSVRIPPLVTTNYEGENVQTLDAVLRVKNGLVGMSGNSEIGQPHVSGSGFKGPMDGVFVNDGYTGTSVNDDGDRGDPTNLWSDNGWDELYDVGDRVSFPTLSDPWREPLTGAKAWDNDNGEWYSHQDYFNQVLLADPNVDTDGFYTGTIDLYTKGQNLYWNATTGIKSATLPATAPAATDDYLIFDAASDTLKINGQLTVNGDFIIRGQGNQTTVHYSGRGAILVNGNVRLDTSLLSCNDGNPANVANSFPVNNCFGIMSAQDMVVGSTAQIDLMGAFYAQGRMSTSKQSNIIGTFVSSYFDMGSNVPSIFQVPELADNLPLGMVGNYPIVSLTQVSWREVGVGL
jgi:hypothetical protein